jgi:hypothetical protein
MMTVPSLTARISRTAAKQRLAASSVAPVASGYEGFLRPCDARFSRSGEAICSGGDC